jgi:hypothetical protein
MEGGAHPQTGYAKEAAGEAGEEIEAVSTQPYFAYGSNMNIEQMKDRCPTAVQKGVAKLPKHRFLINTRGVASVEPDKKADVYGVLWNITAADEAVLDRYEGVNSGLYLKRVLDVQMDARVVPALIYVAANNHYGSSRLRYLETILKGAADNGLPQEYVASLQMWRRSPQVLR